MDEAAKEHDIAYYLHKDSDNRDKADKILEYSALERIAADVATVGEKIAALITAGAMRAKRKFKRKGRR